MASEAKYGMRIHPEGGGKDAAPAAEATVTEFSLGFLHRDNPARVKLLGLVNSKPFDAVILFFIAFNSICMAMTDFRPGCLGRNKNAGDFALPDRQRCGQNGFADLMNTYIFFYVFLVEMIVKIVALGFIWEGQGAYLRDPWNVLDFLCVVAMIMSAMEIKLNLTVIRMFRLLRPLKSVNKFPSLKKLVGTFLLAIPRLGNVVCLLTFLLLIFSIAGMQFFKGALHYRCRITEYPTMVPDTWYRPCDAHADPALYPARYLEDGANCIRGIFFPTNDEFDAYREAMIVREELTRPDDWAAYVASDDYVEVAEAYGWNTADSTRPYWACRNGEFQPENGYENGIPVTDRYRNKYKDYEVPDGKKWRKRQRCIWLIDEDDARPCTLPGASGLHECFRSTRQQRGNGKYSDSYENPETPLLDLDPQTGFLPEDPSLGKTTCGSNYDEYGFPRFKFVPPLHSKQVLSKSVPKKLDDWSRYPTGFFLSMYPEFIEDLNFGYTNFDHLGSAFVTLFQAVTMEGWTDIMYHCMNIYQPGVAVFLFMMLFAVGSMLVLNLVLGVIADTLSDEEEAEEQEAAEERAAAVAAGEAVPEEAKADDDEAADPSVDFVPWRRNLYKFVTHDGFNSFIYLCIFVNTFALIADDYPRPMSWSYAMSMINFVLSLIFIAEMCLKVIAMGPTLYTDDAFNCFDGFIVWVGILSMIFAAMGLNFGGGAVSALRCARVFRIFKLAKNWKSLQVLLKTMVETAQQIGPFLVLLILFTFIFTLAGMQFFANELRFDDDTGAKIRFSARMRVGYNGTNYNEDGAALDSMGKEKYSMDAMTARGHGKRKVHHAFKQSAPPDLNFDDFGMAWVTVFGILTGESWNLVMYDLMRGKASVVWGIAYMFCTQIFLAFFIMNMFLAILLAGFEGNEELTAAAQPSTTKSLSFRQAAKAVKVFSSLERKSGAAGLGDLAIAAAASAKIAPEAGAEQPDVVQQNAGVIRHIADDMAKEEADQKLDDFAADPMVTAVATVPTLGGCFGRGAPKYDRALGLFPKESPVRLTCVRIVSDWRFDALIVACILIGSVLMGATTPLENPLSKKNKFIAAIDLFFTMVYYVEFFLKIVSLGFLFNGHHSYLRDAWNILDFLIVCVSTIDLMQIEGVAAVKVLRVFRVFRPLRMLSRNPGLKLVLNCLVVAIPNAMNVMMVCVIILLIFAIMGVGFFKGQMDMCDFEADFPDHFDATDDQADTIFDLITRPIHLKAAIRTGKYQMLYEVTGGDPQCWVTFNEDYINDKTYFNPRTNVASDEAWRYESYRPSVIASAFSGEGGLKHEMKNGVAPSTAAYFGALYDSTDQLVADLGNPADHLLTVGGNVDMYVPTSKDMCKCIYNDKKHTAWANPLYMSFDHVDTAFWLLFEIYSTEGWLDYMFHNIDARGIEMQPVRDHNYRSPRGIPRFYSILYHIGFQFIGGFFAMQLFVGVIIEQFSKLKEEAEAAGRSSALMTEGQEMWAKTERFLLKIKPKRKIKPKIEAFHRVVEGEHKTLFENSIMACIMANGLVMCVDHFGQPQGITDAVRIINYSFAGIFTIEAILKIGGIGWALYIIDDWNKFDFVIVCGTNVGILLTEADIADIGALASVVRLFRIARIFRLFNSAKNLKKQIAALMSAVPQMFNVMLVLMIFISIFSILLVQLYAHIQFAGAVHHNANFQDFGTAVMTLLRFTTGENWNGFMHDMNFKWKSTGCWDLFGAFDRIRTDMYKGNQAEEVWHTKWCTREDGNDRPVCPCAKFTRDGELKEICQSYATYENCCVPLGGCGNKWVAGIVVHIFDLLVTGVVLNLFVGIILDAYDQEDEEEEDGLTEKHLETFVEDWSRFDENATWFIELSQLKEFIQILDEPMGFGEQYVASNEELELKIMKLGFQIQSKNIDEENIGRSKLHIRDVAMALGKRVVAEREGCSDLDYLPTRSSGAKSGALTQDATPCLERYFGRSLSEIKRASRVKMQDDAAKGPNLIAALAAKAKKPADPTPATAENADTAANADDAEKPQAEPTEDPVVEAATKPEETETKVDEDV